MTARDQDNPHRCTHIERRRDGTEVECNETGGWTLDKAAKTWRPSKPSDKSRRCWAHGPGSDTKPHGPRTKRVQPNAKVQRAAALLLGVAWVLAATARRPPPAGSRIAPGALAFVGTWTSRTSTGTSSRPPRTGSG